MAEEESASGKEEHADGIGDGEGAVNAFEEQRSQVFLLREFGKHAWADLLSARRR